MKINKHQQATKYCRKKRTAEGRNKMAKQHLLYESDMYEEYS